MKVGITFTGLEINDDERIDESINDFTELSAISDLKITIENLGHSTKIYNGYDKLFSDIKNNEFNCDIVFNMAVGRNSRNRMGEIPMLLQKLNVPFVGSDAYTMLVSTNKFHSKLIAKELGIKTPNYYYLQSFDTKDISESLEHLDFPIVVKPNELANSLGIYLVNTASELIEKCRFIHDRFKQPVLLEEYISGYDVMVPIIGNKNIVYGKCIKYTLEDKNISFFDTITKHNPNIICTQVNLPKNHEKEIITSAAKLYNHLPFFDFARFDFRYSDTGEIFFLESNPLPDLNIDGAFCVSLKNDFSSIIDLILSAAKERYYNPQNSK